MGQLVYACIAPHGYEIVGEVAGPEFEKFAPIRTGMEQLGLDMAAAQPDVIVIATPHGYRVENHIAISTNEHAEGRLRKFGVEVGFDIDCSQPLARDLYRRTKNAGIPILDTVYGSAAGSFSILPLDWGCFIPLWFMGGRWEKKPNIVVVTPTRDIGLDSLRQFGRVLAETIAESNTRVAFIASADEGHTHAEDGPYGYHPDAKRYDEMVCDAVEANDLASLLQLDADFIENARPDSLWQIAILVGVQDKVPLEGKLVSYNVPTYYGMMCASFKPEN